MDIITKSNVLKHYKRIEVQRKIVDSAENKEVAGSYGGKGYGKRPDIVQYPSDVFEMVKNGMTSFHISEESWVNPLSIRTGMRSGEYNEIRCGWDLVLDIDCPYWELSRLATFLFIKALVDHGIKSVSVKFSGNKGFHIGVPFEAFPETINEEETKNLFPEGPRKIAAYLLDYVAENYVKVEMDEVDFCGVRKYSLSELIELTEKNIDDFIQNYCVSCKSVIEESKIADQLIFSCSVCGGQVTGEKQEEYMKCEKCGVLMQKDIISRTKKCCLRQEIVKKFDSSLIVEVDTVLIASRHLFRAPYSYHEKSGLISLPIPLKDVLEFDKNNAKIENVNYCVKFLDRETVNRGEATGLILKAFEHHSRKQQKRIEKEEVFKYEKKDQNFEDLQFAIPDKCFPPCIFRANEGLEDGKKRVLFIMINFLRSCGWEKEQVEEYIKNWNEKNKPDQLREVYVNGQMRHAFKEKSKLPPNCDNKAYYSDLQICKPDGLCKYVKNPVNYAKKKARSMQKEIMKEKNKEEKSVASENKKEGNVNKEKNN